MKTETDPVSTITRTDAELIRQFVDHGDQSSFAEIVERYHGLVRNVCKRRLWDSSFDAEDAAQTVFTIFARKATELRSSEGLAGWFHRTAIFVTNDMGRKEQRQKLLRQELRDDQAKVTDTNPDSDAEQREQVLSHMDDAVAQLNGRERDVMIRHYFLRERFESIAKSFGCSADSVRVTAMRARQRLLKMIKLRVPSVSGVILAAILESEAEDLPIPDLSAGDMTKADWGLPIEGNAELPEGIQNTADAVMAEMDRVAAKAMWGWIGVGAAGLATIGVGTALVVSHLQPAPTTTNRVTTVMPVATTLWRVDSVIGDVLVRRGDATLAVKTGDVFCLGDTILTSSGQEVQAVSEMGDRVLLREEGEVGFERRTSNTEHRTSKLEEGDTQFRIVKGAVVAQVKHSTCLATQHAKMNTDGAELFLMLVSGLTTNGAPWSFTRLDVTNGAVNFLSSSISDLKSEIALGTGQFALAGTACEGGAFTTVSGKSAGREMSPKYGGCFFREYAEFYDRERKSIGEVKSSNTGRVLKEWGPRALAEQAILEGMQSPDIVESNGRTVARFCPLDGARPGSVVFSVGSNSFPNSVLELDFCMEQSKGNGSPPSFGLQLPESNVFRPAGAQFVMPWSAKSQFTVRPSEWAKLRLSRVMVGQHMGEWILNEIVTVVNGSMVTREWGADPRQGVRLDLLNMTLSVSGARLYALE